MVDLLVGVGQYTGWPAPGWIPHIYSLNLGIRLQTQENNPALEKFLNRLPVVSSDGQTTIVDGGACLSVTGNK